MTAAEQDADETFWYNEVGGVVEPCASDPPPKVLSDSPHWIEIAMVDREGNAVEGQSYEITLPNGAVVTGSLDSRGVARIQGIDNVGNCKIRFPGLDKSAVKKK